MVYLDDPKVLIDTNHLERALRVIPMGKKNSLFSWTELGAKHVGIVQACWPLVGCTTSTRMSTSWMCCRESASTRRHPCISLRHGSGRKMFVENPLPFDLHDLGGRKTCFAA